LRKNQSIKTKIISLSVGAAVLPSLTIILLLLIKLTALKNDTQYQAEKSDKEKITQIVGNIYKSCSLTDDFINQQLGAALDMAEKIIKEKNGFAVKTTMNKIDIINQFTKNKTTVEVPQFILGGQIVNLNRDFDVYSPVVDEIKMFKNVKLTLFQKINPEGDMLRIATTVESKDKKRAVGTYIPAINPNGEENPVIQTVINGGTFYGNAYVVDYWYQTIYRPIKNNNGQVVGMLFAGMSLNNVNVLREMILNTKVGKTGYVYVLSGSGERKGTYIISKKGERDGENIWNSKDIDGQLIIQKIVNQATTNGKGEVSFIDYNWLNKGDKVPLKKTVALIYFKPFDWVIGAGANTEEVFALADEIGTSFSSIFIWGIIVSIVSITIMMIIAIFVSRKIAYPIIKAAEIMTNIADGNIDTALKDFEILDKQYNKK
jgi:hypothetical protein